MNSPLGELNTTQRKQECIDHDDPSLEGCGSEKDLNVHHGPAGIPVWPGPLSYVSLSGVVPHPLQHTFQPGMVDPFILSSVPCAPDSIHHSSVSEPIYCSMMPVSLHDPVASIYVPEAMAHKQFQEGLTELTSHLTQPLVQFNPCEPGPSPQPGNNGLTSGKGVSVLGTPSQLHQYPQAACPPYESRDQTANIQPQAPSVQTVSTLCESESSKPCHCIKSQCLKLYCQCFANGVMCSNCHCSNCHNNVEHEINHQRATETCLGRDPDAFRLNIAGGKSRGCKSCKNSGCLKKYCKCYKANIMCTSSCKCVGCRNHGNGSEMERENTINAKEKLPGSVITPAVVEAVHSCLMTQAEKAERDAQSPAQAERMVLEEFGQCLSQIVKAMFNTN